MAAETDELLGRVERKLAAFKSKPIVSGILSALKAELPAQLSYHNYDHTEDVLHEVLLFAIYDDLSEREMELLAIAAAFHDAGFVKTFRDNETLGAQMARQAMRVEGGYTEEEMDLVAQMIIDTKIVQMPDGLRQIASTQLSPYLLDADLSNLGRDDFFDKLELVRQELGVKRDGFLRTTLQLISGQQWYTDAAKALREPKKMENIRNLKTWIVRSGA